MSDEARKFLNNYGDFVTKVTSEPSLNQTSLDAVNDERASFHSGIPDCGTLKQMRRFDKFHRKSCVREQKTCDETS